MSRSTDQKFHDPEDHSSYEDIIIYLQQDDDSESAEDLRSEARKKIFKNFLKACDYLSQTEDMLNSDLREDREQALTCLQSWITVWKKVLEMYDIEKLIE